LGYGTEKIEDDLQNLFPEARIKRMDLDTTRTRTAYEKIISDFQEGKTDILIGTQMVTKGLHFNDVSLVVVLQADMLINKPDFRSTEQAFQMLEQVAGRAGRAGQQGEVMIQTFDPKNPIFNFLQSHDYQQLYNKEIIERKAF
jgi:primosomal protein N' (replication factor Y)